GREKGTRPSGEGNFRGRKKSLGHGSRFGGRADRSTHPRTGRSPACGYHTASTAPGGGGRRGRRGPRGTPRDRGGGDLREGMGPRGPGPHEAVPRGTTRRGVRGPRARRARCPRRRVKRDGE